MRTNTLLRISFWTIGALFVGTGGFVTFANHYAYQELQLQFNDAFRVFNTAGAMRYGTVESIDTAHRTITLRIVDRTVPGDSTRLFTLRVGAQAYIAKQELTETDGIYNALPEPISASLSDIPPGTRVAALVRPTPDFFEAEMILFGNPL
jgi:hypothetical protein